MVEVTAAFLEVLKNLLSSEVTLWITIDDYEAHYLNVVCDEVFGKKNFVANIVWQKNILSRTTLSGSAPAMIMCLYMRRIRRRGGRTKWSGQKIN